MKGKKKWRGKKSHRLSLLLLLSGRIKEASGASRGFKYSGAVSSYFERSSQTTDALQSWGV